jgi:hypothetical protein
MVSIGLSKALNRKEIQTIGNPSTYLLRTKQGRINWELKNYSELEKVMLKWHNAVYILSHSQIFTDGIYEYFAFKDPSDKNFSTNRINDIIQFISSKYKTYLRRDISEEELQNINDFLVDIRKGHKIDNNIIFPVIYYPFMDKSYYDHANWNKVPEAVGISDIIHRKKKYRVRKLKKIDINPYSKSNNKCSNNNCTCKESLSNENKLCNCKTTLNDSTAGIEEPKLLNLSLDEFQPFNQKPIIYVGYGDTFGHTGYKLIARCKCMIRISGTVSYCSTNGDGKDCSEWLPCPNVACPSKGWEWDYSFSL